MPSVTCDERILRWGLRVLCSLFLVISLSGTLNVVHAQTNDAFSSRIRLSGASGQTDGNNVGASKETGEPDHAGNRGGASVWWAWTAPAAGEVTFDTEGSDFDTLLAVYSGNSVNRLVEVGSNDDIGGGMRQSEVRFRVRQGQTYHIAVDGYGGKTGHVVLNWQGLSSGVGSDAFVSRGVLSGASGRTDGSNVGASKEAGEPDHAGNRGGASVWWTWTAPAAGEFTFDTRGSDFDTLLAVYGGTRVNGLTEVGSNDDIGGGMRQSEVRFTARQGRTYQIAVDGYGGKTGHVALNWGSGSGLVSAGSVHTCRVLATGVVECWGTEGVGPSTLPDGTFTSVSAGLFHTCGVLDTGAVECWGWDNVGQSTPPAGTFTSVSAGGYHTCGVLDAGAVECWGSDEEGQSTPPAGTFTSVSAGLAHTCGVLDTGAVECWGWDEYGQSTPPDGTFTSVSAGWEHTCGVLDTGAVECWGDDEDGQSTPPAGTFTSVSAGSYHTCGVLDTSGVECWGWDGNGQSTPPGSDGSGSSPDLIVASPSVSDDSPSAGQSFTLQATVRNQGTASSTATILRYYQSADVTISAADTPVGTGTVSGLDAADTSSESIRLTAPSNAGTYYYGACVESVNGENNTGNNCSSGVRVTVSSDDGGGDTFTTADALPGVPTSGLFIPAIVSGASVSASGGGTTVTFNNGGYIELQNGTRYTCQTAGGCEVRDGVVTRGTIVSGATAAGAPDLVVQSPSVSDSSPDAGVSFTLRATVRNRGNGRSAAATLRYYRSSNLTISASDTRVGTDAVGALAAGGTSSESVSLTAPSSAGTYYYGACVDAVSGESNTGNNCSSGVQVTVGSGGGGGPTQADLETPKGLALDVSAGKMYWTDHGTDKIHRANLDGSQVETLISTGLDDPKGLALDVSAGKMYWTDYGTDKIHRANLDGSQVETLVSGFEQLEGLALDVSASKMYWTDLGADKIHRANLDGSQAETLISSGLDNPNGLALDASAGKMYWTETGADKILRANLAGSQVETLVIPRGSGGGGGGGTGGACTAGLVVNPGESCTYKGYSFTVSSSGRGSIAFFSAGTGINAINTTINGVVWNFHATKNSGSNSWTIHTAD